MANIKEYLNDFNPWWSTKLVSEFRNRQIYEQIKNFLEVPHIIALTGLRRVGKTTIMLKLAEDQIKKGFDPKNILYFSFDEFKTSSIRMVLNEYELLMNKNLKEGKFLILFDEIQKVDDWENQLKTIYDLFGKKAKIIISGSESLFIRKKSKESLAGRIFEFKVNLLTFEEFLEFRNFEYTQIDLHAKELKKLLKEFSLSLGFPELINQKEKILIRKYVKESILDKVIYKDIPELVKIENPVLLESLLNLITDEPGQIMDFIDLAREFNVSRQTISLYLYYLEKAFLIRKLYNFSKNKRKVEKKSKKYYPVINSIELVFKEEEFFQSKVFETLIVNQLEAEFFWRDTSQNEVDIVLSNKEIIPIEIKYGKIKTKGLQIFIKKFNTKNNYIISYDQESEEKINGKKIKIIPSYKFLLRKKELIHDK